MRIAVLVLIALAALAAPLWLPRGDGPPDLRSADSYLVNEEIALFEGSLEEVAAALRSEAGGVLAFTEATDRIPAITGTRPVSGTFPDVGAVRIVDLASGDSATERVLEHSDTRFAYQVWALTALSAIGIDHIHGSFDYTALEDGSTEVVWRYAVAPRAFYLRPFIRGFLENDFAPFMQSGLHGAAAAFNDRIQS